MREFTIDGKRITDDSDCYVIAEIGNNHQGDLETAMQMFRVADSCGVDAVKLQTRNNRELFTEAGYNAPYDNESSYGATYGLHRDYLEFGVGEYFELMSLAKELGISMFSTPFDFKSADFLYELGMEFFKVASGDLRNIPFLKHIAGFGKPMIVSTGGATMIDVERAHDAVMPINSQLCLMQCTAAYPADFNVLNLRVIETYRNRFPGVTVGLSSHDNGIAMAGVAYVLGARVIEKHFTLNHTMKGTDHAFSLEPIGLQKMVRDLRRVKIALGDGIKRVYPVEEKPIEKMAKSLYAARDIPVGHTLDECDIVFKSPGIGIAPYRVDEFIGGKVIMPVHKDDPINAFNVGGGVF